MNQAELLRYLVETLEVLGIEYMITGSQASIYYGEPRFTQDIDVVADLTLAHVPALLSRFPLKDTPYHRAEFGRRHRQPILPGAEAYFEMLFFRAGASERHLRDIAGMLRISGAGIDMEYISEWVQRLDLNAIWDVVRRRASDG